MSKGREKASGNIKSSRQWWREIWKHTVECASRAIVFLNTCPTKQTLFGLDKRVNSDISRIVSLEHLSFWWNMSQIFSHLAYGYCLVGSMFFQHVLRNRCFLTFNEWRCTHQCMPSLRHLPIILFCMKLDGICIGYHLISAGKLFSWAFWGHNLFSSLAQYSLHAAVVAVYSLAC